MIMIFKSLYKFWDLSLNAVIEKDKFLPGPLKTVFSLIDKIIFKFNFEAPINFIKFWGGYVIGKTARYF